MMKMVKSILDWVGSIGIAFIIALLISTFVIQPSKVIGHSMDPTLHDNQFIFVSKLLHTFRYEPEYGDIVVIDSQVNRKRTIMDDLKDNALFKWLTHKQTRETYIKRVIGKPGDLIEIKNNQLYRNGKLVDEPYIKDKNWAPFDEEVFHVPEGHIFVLGDNRNMSKDSRMIGFIPLSHVLGKKIF